MDSSSRKKCPYDIPGCHCVYIKGLVYLTDDCCYPQYVGKNYHSRECKKVASSKLENPTHKVCLKCDGIKECPEECQRGDSHAWCDCQIPDETITTSTTGGKKGMKPESFSFIPYEPLMSVARVFGYGMRKYGDTPKDPNWRKGYEWSKNFDALNRHIWAFWNGEWSDPESKQPHLAHAAWHILVLMHFYMRDYRQFDDRPIEKP